MITIPITLETMQQLIKPWRRSQGPWCQKKILLEKLQKKTAKNCDIKKLKINQWAKNLSMILSSNLNGGFLTPAKQTRIMTKNVKKIKKKSKICLKKC